ncbi:MAG: sugar ABC transporter permease [Bacillota bacterium]|nr:sugar ABC transporter permease [Bacillota bacterium]HHT89741.1 sugar ABC transporter permease [Bacillota bacterium]
MAKHVRRRSNYRVPWLFALPAVLYMGAFLLYPLLSALRISFSEYNFVYSEKPIFNGLANYVQLFNDPHFIVSFKNTVYYTLVFFPLFMLLSLFLALLLNTKIKGTNIFQAAILLPIVVPLSLAGIMFTWIFSQDFGIVNHILANVLHLPHLQRFWLGDVETAMNSLVVVGLWKYVGFGIILFLSGLKAISEDIYEAAKVDGVNAWQNLIYITLPNLKSSFSLVGIWGIIQAIKVYDQVVVMTNGGPGTATSVLYLYAWKNAFTFFNMGLGEAIAFFTAALAIVVSVFFNLVFKSEKR